MYPIGTETMRLYQSSSHLYQTWTPSSFHAWHIATVVANVNTWAQAHMYSCVTVILIRGSLLCIDYSTAKTYTDKFGTISQRAVSFNLQQIDH